MSDAKITDTLLFLPGTQSRDLGLSVDQVMDLDKVEPLGLKPLQRPFHGSDALRFPGCPNLCRQKERLAQAELSRDLAEDLFRPAIHRRRIHQPATQSDESRQHLFEWLAFALVGPGIEDLPAFPTHNLEFFAGRWNRTL